MAGYPSEVDLFWAQIVLQYLVQSYLFCLNLSCRSYETFAVQYLTSPKIYTYTGSHLHQVRLKSSVTTSGF